MTFDDLVKEKPELKEIQAKAKDWYSKPDRWMYYERLKSEMKRCVGRTAKDAPEFMQTSEAYDIAHQAIFKQPA